jgi:GntR family transcriptional regulator/MocR family aminotransferase
VQGIEQCLGPWLEVMPGNAGLHLSARLRRGSSAAAVFQAARDHLPGALPLTAYAAAPTRAHGLCIGYGCVEVDQIVRAVRGMGRALDERE